MVDWSGISRMLASIFTATIGSAMPAGASSRQNDTRWFASLCEITALKSGGRASTHGKSDPAGQFCRDQLLP